MKIDFDFIREIMDKINESPDKINSKMFLSEENTLQKVSFHIEALIEGNYIKAKKVHHINMDYPEYEIQHLTIPKGTEFFSEIKNKTIWEKVKTIANIKDMPLSFHIISKIAIPLIDKHLAK